MIVTEHTDTRHSKPVSGIIIIDNKISVGIDETLAKAHQLDPAILRQKAKRALDSIKLHPFAAPDSLYIYPHRAPKILGVSTTADAIARLRTLLEMSVIEGHDPIAVDWALRANGRNDIPDVYFPTEKLAHNDKEFRWPFFLNDKTGGKLDVLLPEAVNFLKKKGAGRIAYFGAGWHSVIFKTVPDQSGRMQLVTITPSEDERIPHPAMVPNKEDKLIEKDGASLRIRITPALTIEGVTKEHQSRLKEIFNKSNETFNDPKVKIADLDRIRNIVLDRTPEGLVLPYCCDMGAVRWCSDTTKDEKSALEARWKNDPALAHYNENNERLMGAKKLENTLTEDAAQFSGTLKAAHAALMYPGDIAPASEAALQAADKQTDMPPGDFWRRQFRENIEGKIKTFDPAQKPGRF